MTTQDSAGGVPLDVLLEHRDWVRALARSLVSDPNRADDVEQEAWRMAIERPPRHAQSVRAWFRVVVRNAARKAWRRDQSVARTQTGAPEHAPVPSPAELVAQAEIQHRLVRAVLQLDEPYRSAVLYRFFEALPPRKIAARLGVPVETVRTRLKRGIARLRERMEAELGDDRRAWSLLLLGYVPEPPALTTAAASGAGTASLFGGGLAVAYMTKIVTAGAIVLVLALGAAWLANDTRVGPPATGDGAAEIADASGADGPTRARTASTSTRADTEVPANQGPPGVDLDACDRERDLHGVVRDLDGAPVAGARVVVLRRPPWGQTFSQPQQITRPAHEDVETLSAADGAFSLRLEPAAGVGLRVDADGYALWESRFRQAGERLIVTLTPAAPLTVHVRHADGTPAAETLVRIFLELADGEGTRHGDTTDAEGRVAFDRLPQGAGGQATLVTHGLVIASQHFALTNASGQTLEFELPARRRLAGQATDAASGIGIEGALVSMGLGSSAATDSLGRFEIDAYAKARIEAVADGYAAHVSAVPAEGDVTLELQRAARVTGRVVDESGAAVSGADVAITATTRSMDTSHGGAVTDEDGHFEMSGLLAGHQHLLRIERTGFALSYSGFYLPESASGSTHIGATTLRAPHTVRGIVIGADDERLARISLRISGPDARGDHVLHLRRASDDLGRFAFTDLPPGSYEIRATTSGLQRFFAVTVPEIGDGPTETLRLVPEEKPAGKSITMKARVRDEHGDPVPEVRVTFTYAANGGTRHTPTDASGAMTVDAEFEPAMVSTALSPEQRKIWMRAHQWLRPGQRDVALVLRRGEPVSGRVVDAKGHAIAGAWVEAMDGLLQVAVASADADGRFAFAIPAGTTVTLQARPPMSFQNTTRRLAARPNVGAGTADVVLTIGDEPDERTIAVEVVDESGGAVEGTAVQARFVGQDQMHPIMAVTDADGRAELPGLPRTPVTVLAFVSDSDRLPETYGLTPALVAGDEDSVRFTMSEPRVLVGRVVDETGAAVGGALVNYFQFGSACTAKADAGGYFELRVPQDALTPAPIHAQPWPFDPKKPLSGYELLEETDRELTIVLRPIPGR